jgi:hypothetical protein
LPPSSAPVEVDQEGRSGEGNGSSLNITRQTRTALPHDSPTWVGWVSGCSSRSVTKLPPLFTRCSPPLTTCIARFLLNTNIFSNSSCEIAIYLQNARCRATVIPLLYPSLGSPLSSRSFKRPITNRRASTLWIGLRRSNSFERRRCRS